MSVRIRSSPLTKLLLGGALVGCQGAPRTPAAQSRFVHQHVLDLDGDKLNDTVVVYTFLYGPGLKQAVPFEKVRAEPGETDAAAYHLLQDVYWLRGKQKKVVLTLEKQEFAPGFLTRPTDSLTVQPLAGGPGLRLENKSGEVVPDITFLDLSLRHGKLRASKFGHINTTGPPYSANFWADTCYVLLTDEVASSERLNTDRLSNSIEPEKWRCQ